LVSKNIVQTSMREDVQFVAKKPGTVRIKLTHFYIV
jgi:hypothetical protein